MKRVRKKKEKWENCDVFWMSSHYYQRELNEGHKKYKNIRKKGKEKKIYLFETFFFSIINNSKSFFSLFYTPSFEEIEEEK
jgi:hypothetical protein